MVKLYRGDKQNKENNDYKQTFHFAKNPLNGPNTAFAWHTNLEDNSLHQEPNKKFNILRSKFPCIIMNSFLNWKYSTEHQIQTT